MAKAGRGQTRRDSKRRVLRPGESVRADGKYQYKYHIDGKPHFVYSWKLEKQVNTDLDLLVNIVDVQMTVCELVDRYLKTKTGVRQSTKQGYVTVQRLLAKESFQVIIEDRNVPKVEKSIDGYSGFLFYDDNGMPLVAMHWQHRFNHMVGRYNDIYRMQMPKHYSTCMPAHLLHKYGKIRNESKSIAIFDGPLRHQRNAEYIYACKS